jgi:hypothetical protein
MLRARSDARVLREISKRIPDCFYSAASITCRALRLRLKLRNLGECCLLILRELRGVDAELEEKRVDYRGNFNSP